MSPARCSPGSGRASTRHDIPITSITNGVHAPTWVAREVFELADSEGVLDDLERRPRLERRRQDPVADRSGRPSASCASNLVDDVRERVRESWLQRGATPAELGWVDSVLDPDVLTIGFARRVPTYKRLTLMLRDPDRLKRLLLAPRAARSSS